MRFLKAFGRFWYDFIVGDDWKIAAAVALVIAVGAVLVATSAMPSAALAPLLGVAFLAVAVLVDAHK